MASHASPACLAFHQQMTRFRTQRQKMKKLTVLLSVRETQTSRMFVCSKMSSRMLSFTVDRTGAEAGG